MAKFAVDMKEDHHKRYETCFELYKKYAGRKMGPTNRAGSRDLVGRNRFNRGIRIADCGMKNKKV